uniref:ORC4_C domain-containing protein n=1 Tax=Panagrellus redivivus TaxID=6233 RepID=A0A7E4ZTE0_PANRE
MAKSALINAIEDSLIGLDNQLESLTNVFDRFVVSKEGCSCLLLGPPQSGKTAMINQVRQKVYPSSNVVIIDGFFCDDAAGTNLLGDDFENQKLIIVDNFEQFTQRNRQQLLYTIINKACASKCLVIFCSRDMTATDNVEKRVRSRMGNLKIFSTTDEVVEPIEALRALLLPKSWKCDNKDAKKAWESLIDDVTSRGVVIRDVERVVASSAGGGFSKLKRFASLFAEYYFETDIIPADADILRQLERIVPRNSNMVEYVEDLEVHEAFILELIRRLSKRSGNPHVPYLNVFQNFNLVFRAMHQPPRAKTLVYFYLDKLIQKGAIEVKPGSTKGQIDYRPVQNRIDGSVIEKAWLQRSRLSYLSDAFRNTANLQL